MYRNVTESLMYIRTVHSSSLIVFVAHIYHISYPHFLVFVRCGEDFLSLSPVPQIFFAYFFSRSLSTRRFGNPDTDALASASAESSSPTDIEAISNASTSIASEPYDANDSPIGLSDPQYVGQRRQMLDYVNRLRATG